MELLKCLFIVQLICVCQAFQNSSARPDVQVPGDGKSSELQEEVSSDPVIQRHPSRCSWVLRMPGNSSGGVPVAISSEVADALVERVCEDLGCGGVYRVDRRRSPPAASCFHRCSYQDGRLQNCSQSVGGNCTVMTETVCEHQAVRLAGGTDRCAGRVEILRHGRWGSVCDDRWDLSDAHVVCAQLGCGYALTATGQGGPFPPGRGPVHLDELNCTGSEGNLWSCQASGDESDCGHKEDAGVVCSEMRAVRLSGGLDRCSGKVELHRNGSWGTLCDHCWDGDMAAMVCSMLRCGAEPLQFTRFLPPPAHNNGTLWFYTCPEQAQDLWQCQEFINQPHLCSGSKASSVVCNGSLGFPPSTTDSTATTGLPLIPDSSRPAGNFSLPVSPELLSSMSVSLLLLVLLITNTLLCCHYRKRHAVLLQTQSSAATLLQTSARQQHNYQDAVSLVKVTSHKTQPTDVASDPRSLWSQFSNVDSTSVDTDYEQFEPSNDPSVPLSTFRNSQRYRTDMNPLNVPPALHSLSEEGPQTTNQVTGVFTSDNGHLTDAQYSRVSKVPSDSFETSSTSSGEAYENIQNGSIADGPSDALGTSDPPRFLFSTDQTHLPPPVDEEEGPVYAPVSPDCDTSTDDDYDDIGA